VVSAALAAIAIIVGYGCATPRAALGPRSSPCFQALPPATLAVGHQGKFAGLTLADVPARLGGPRVLRTPPTVGAGPRTTAPRTTAPRTTATSGVPTTSAPAGVGSTTTLPRRDVCLVAFKGTFDASKIPLLRGPLKTGQYAVVVVAVRSHRAVLVYLTDTLPRAFKHL
jgi:hypothetical protein